MIHWEFSAVYLFIKYSCLSTILVYWCEVVTEKALVYEGSFAHLHYSSSAKSPLGCPDESRTKNLHYLVPCNTTETCLERSAL
jgi:hypothetical protein